VVFGLVPAFQATGYGARRSLGQAARTVIGGHEGIRSVLTVSEMGLALILLTGAGLMLKRFLRMPAAEAGLCLSRCSEMTLALPVGREFTESEYATAPGVAIVSQSVARTLWPGQDPLGKRISMEDEPKPEDWLTVVGVVDDVKQQGLAKNSEPAIYQPYLQV